MRFAYVAAGALAIGATVTEGRSVGSTPKKNHESAKGMKAPLLKPLSGLKKRANVKNDGWNATPSNVAPNKGDLDSSSPVPDEDAPNPKGPDSGSLRNEKSLKGPTSTQRATTSTHRTGTPTRPEAVPDNVFWIIENKPVQAAGKPENPEFIIKRVYPTGSATQDQTNKPGSLPGNFEEKKPSLFAVTDASEKANSTPASALLSAIETYREAMTKDNQTDATTSPLDMVQQRTVKPDPSHIPTQGVKAKETQPATPSSMVPVSLLKAMQEIGNALNNYQVEPPTFNNETSTPSNLLESINGTNSSSQPHALTRDVENTSSVSSTNQTTSSISNSTHLPSQ